MLSDLQLVMINSRLYLQFVALVYSIHVHVSLLSVIRCVSICLQKCVGNKSFNYFSFASFLDVYCPSSLHSSHLWYICVVME